MTNNYKTLYAIITVLILIVVIQFKSCNKKEKPKRIETIVTERVDYTKIVDSIYKTLEERVDTVTIYKYKNKYITKTEFKTIVVKEDKIEIEEHGLGISTKDTTVFDNGILFSRYLSKDKILSVEHKLEVDEKLIYRDIETKVINNASGLFLEGGVGFIENFNVLRVDAGLNYIIKNKISIGTGLSVLTKEIERTPLTFNIKAGFKL